MAKFVGYEMHDGVFCPGGSIANMYAIMIARHQKFPEAKVSFESMNSPSKLLLLKRQSG